MLIFGNILGFCIRFCLAADFDSHYVTNCRSKYEIAAGKVMDFLPSTCYNQAVKGRVTVWK